MVANLHHMEEMSFLCKTCFFLMCLSCTDDDESQQMNPPLALFVSASSFLSPQGREAANRHQGREQAFILSAVPFLLKSHFLLFSIYSPLRNT